VAHARSLGANATFARNLSDLGRELKKARSADRTSVIVIETDPTKSTAAGGAWWDVPVAEVSESRAVRNAHKQYRKAREQ
jgi:3D-(3,5/4)-trihydroxycyclohexane-1,2-dione acylhydrolase (decyclizing)